MIKSVAVVITACVFSTVGNAQSTITYYDQYGMRKGSAKITSNESPYKPLQPAPYVSSMPSYDLIMAVGKAKQQTYDERTKWIQDKVDDVTNNRIRFFKNYPDQKDYFKKEVIAFVNKINDGDYDLTDDRIFNRLATELKDIEESVYLTYEDLMKEEGKRK